MTTWLTIVGIGDDGFEGLSVRARSALAQARTIIGSNRTLGFLPPTAAQRLEWPQPFSRATGQIAELRGTATVILATGDPMNHGVARKIFEMFPREDVTVIPHVSSFSLAAACMGWSIPDCDCFSIHGRPSAQLEPFIQPGARLLVLTQDGSSVAEAARRLCARGFEESEITVLENLGGPLEKHTRTTANTVPVQKWSDLHVLAIVCKAGRAAKFIPRGPGLPDDCFENDGTMTKRDVRAATLAALGPAPGQVLWDVGAGSGAISIEWMRSARGCEAIAFERDPTRLNTIAKNAEALGVPRLRVVAGSAPESFAGHASPDAVFVGGGITAPGVFEQSWTALRSLGMMVANTVTLEGQTRLTELQKHHGGELVRIDVSVLSAVGTLHALRPQMSVLQWRLRKP